MDQDQDMMALGAAISIGLLMWIFLTLIAERLEEGERSVKRSRERQLPEWLEANRIELEKKTGGTIVMPEINLPDDFEPPPMLPGD